MPVIKDKGCSCSTKFIPGRTYVCKGPGKHFDVSWLDENPFELLIDVETEEADDMTLKELRRVNTASDVTNQIWGILEEAASEIKKLERHRLGIGDTSTDEAIAGEFYSLIH